MTQRIALVTGAVGGLGTAICKSLAAEGIRVVSAIAGLVTLLMWPEAQLRPGWVVTGYALGLMSIWLVALKKN